MAWDKILSDNGFKTSLYARFIDKKFKSKIKFWKNFDAKKYDLVILHLAIGDPVNDMVKDIDTPLLIYYHNITPAKYYREYNWDLFSLLEEGREQMRELAKYPKLAFAASEYSIDELKEAGYKNIIKFPVFFETERLSKVKADKKTMQFLKENDTVNITFLGRFSRHKSQVDHVKAFYIYQKYINPNSRLNLVGNCFEKKYMKVVRDLIRKLGISEKINVPGIVSDEVMRSYYEYSDVFLSMSEHEGFFVPVLESNYYKVPMIAYNAGAIKETMGNAGILVNTKDPAVIAETINKVVTDKKLREQIIKNGEENYKRFSQELYEDELVKIMNEYIK
ncbi:MAG: glycosyltransferase family 4 protein [Ignavibacteriae bacterium]|nr:glycosyltransferase family 4 protein [Ignavibacteriota bacterium]